MRKKIGLLLALPLITFAANSSAPEPQPGLYRVTVGVTGENMPPGMVEESTEQCVTKDDLAADPSTLLGENAGMEGCEITENSWGNGKISMKLECSIEGALASAESKGSYNASSYELITTMTIKMGEMSMDMKTTVRGERIGDC